ncbi:hypothetical protein Tco_1252573 [Tanacetum coccineum]
MLGMKLLGKQKTLGKTIRVLEEIKETGMQQVKEEGLVKRGLLFWELLKAAVLLEYTFSHGYGCKVLAVMVTGRFENRSSPRVLVSTAGHKQQMCTAGLNKLKVSTADPNKGFVFINSDGGDPDINWKRSFR